MQVDSVGVGESATPTPVPSMGGSQATEASTGEEEENHEMTEEEYLAYLKDNILLEKWLRIELREYAFIAVKNIVLICIQMVRHPFLSILISVTSILQTLKC